MTDDDKMKKGIKEKYNSDTALAKIKVMISSYYENKGRDGSNDDYCDLSELVYKIDDILYESNINIKRVILEKLELDNSISIQE